MLYWIGSAPGDFWVCVLFVGGDDDGNNISIPIFFLCMSKLIF